MSIMRGEKMRTGKLLHNPAIKALVVAIFGENYTKKDVYEVGEAVLGAVDLMNNWNYKDATDFYDILKINLKDEVGQLNRQSTQATNDALKAAMLNLLFTIAFQIRPPEDDPEDED